MGGVASLPRPLTGHESSHRGESCFPPRTNSPLPLKGEGRDFAHLWGFGFSLAVAFGNRWPQLAHTGPTGRVCCFSGVVSLPGSHNRTQGRTGASLDFLPRTSLPLPLKGEGLGIVCCLVRLVFSRREARCFSAGKDGYFVSEGFSMQLPVATAGHKRLTRLQQRPSGAALVSFPYLAVKTAHGGTRGRVWFSPSFPGTLLLRKSRKLALQVVIHRIVNGKDRVKQRPVSRSAV